MDVDICPIFQASFSGLIGIIHLFSGLVSLLAHFQLPIDEQKQQPSAFIFIINFTVTGLFTLQSIPIFFHISQINLFRSLLYVLHNVMGNLRLSPVF